MFRLRLVRVCSDYGLYFSYLMISENNTYCKLKDSSNNSYTIFYEFIRGKINYCRTDQSHTKNCIYEKVHIFANSQKFFSHMA